MIHLRLLHDGKLETKEERSVAAEMQITAIVTILHISRASLSVLKDISGFLYFAFGILFAFNIEMLAHFLQY